MKYTEYEKHLRVYLRELLGVDSPSGFTEKAADRLEALIAGMGYESRRTRRGNVMVRVPGPEGAGTVGLASHIDTLGLIVRSVSAKGEVMFSRIGGPVLPSLDGEYCRVYTRDGRVHTGTGLSLSPAKHVFPDASTRIRDEDNMYVRLDCEVRSREDVLALGILPGDFICYDPKFEITETGFVKSRFLDDKASAACLLTVLRLMKEQGARPARSAEFIFTVYEEVGSGGATVPEDLDELLIVDMGCVGLDLNCTETQVSICPKDSAGPYDYAMTGRLIELAKKHGVDYALDVYPMYSSDAAVAWRAGHDVPAALIGPGVQASHGMERTHLKALLDTGKLIGAYLGLE